MLYRRILLLLIIINSFFNTKSESADNNMRYGLTFRSHSVNQDQRTGVDLSNCNLFLKPGSTIEFDLRLDKKPEGTYGYIFRLICNDTLSLDFIANTSLLKVNFVVASTRHIYCNKEFHLDNNYDEKHWFPVKIRFNISDIECSFNETTSKIPFSIPNLKNAQLHLGKNHHGNFYTTDVPPMSIRDLKVCDEKGKTLRHWKFAKHLESSVLDEIDGCIALVKNGEWEIDRHISWEPVISMHFKETNPQIAYDSDSGRIFIATADSLITYSVTTDIVSRVKTNKGAPFRCGGGSALLYDKERNCLISYSTQFPDLNIYNFQTQSWSGSGTEILPPIQQHNHFIDYKNHKLVLFGGYGMHQYKANLIVRDLFDGAWKTTDLKTQIMPRYLSAAGLYEDSILMVMGGYGSPSGKQEELPQNLYDLYKIDYPNAQCEKVTNFSIAGDPIAMGNSLLIDKNEHTVYTLAYNNDRYNSLLYLISLDWESSRTTILGDTILYHFFDSESYCDLFLDKESNNLYAIILQQAPNQNGYFVSIYSMAYPVLQSKDVLQAEKTSPQPRAKLIFGGIGIICLILISYWIWLKKQKKHSQIISPEIITSANTKVNPIPNEPSPIPVTSTINLLGGFQVFDRQGIDVTGGFSSVLRQLFLFILLHSVKNDGRGVSSLMLDEAFWSGMDKKSASNNRSVNIRRLRLLLNNIGDITLTNENSYWNIKLGKDVFCDYIEIWKQLKKYQKRNSNYNRETIETIIALSSKGMLLPNVNAEWADEFKSEYVSRVSDILLSAIALPEYSSDSKLSLQIADVVLLLYPTEEEAVKLKCRLLYQLGHKVLSRQCYDKFCAQYMSLLDAQPDFSYEDIISSKNND